MKASSADYVKQYINQEHCLYKSQIQKLLGISRSTLARWIKSGDFPPPSAIHKRRSCWTFNQVEQWQSQHKAG